MAARGKRSCWPVVALSKQQTCVSMSTPEAQMVASHHALRTAVAPGLELWGKLLPNGPKMKVLLLQVYCQQLHNEI
jgi:hypothetical protein